MKLNEIEQHEGTDCVLLFLILLVLIDMKRMSVSSSILLSCAGTRLNTLESVSGHEGVKGVDVSTVGSYMESFPLSRPIRAQHSAPQGEREREGGRGRGSVVFQAEQEFEF